MKKSFTVRLEEEQIASLETVAGSRHGMEATTYGAVVLATLSKLRPEFALDALACIPKGFFVGAEGRPPTAAVRTHGNAKRTPLDNQGKNGVSLPQG